MKFYSIIFPLQFKCVVDHLSGDRATGNGSGVQVVLTTSTGCVHGGDGVGSPKRDPTELGRSAAEMALKSAAKVCVDQHMQVRAIFVVLFLSWWLLMGADDPGPGLALVLKVCSKPPLLPPPSPFVQTLFVNVPKCLIASTLPRSIC